MVQPFTIGQITIATLRGCTGAFGRAVVGARPVAIVGDYWFDEEVKVEAVRLLTRRTASAEVVAEARRRRRVATLSSVDDGRWH